MSTATRHLDTRFQALRPLATTARPPKGWLRAIRDALGMTTGQFAARLNVTQPRVVQLEKAEIDGSITLNTLERAAAALGCRVVYAIVPERPLDDTIRQRANLVADRQLASIEQTMRLENQAVEDNRARTSQRQQLLADLLAHPSRLWRDT
ncbi:MAG TPA: mobile mystery protein A [Rhizomicrobium sp.]|jgi:predicted DNA-binding mobile mystery protein A|nr:mobile mystery protein A [Rhizomicrobium sp.]